MSSERPEDIIEVLFPPLREFAREGIIDVRKPGELSKILSINEELRSELMSHESKQANFLALQANILIKAKLKKAEINTPETEEKDSAGMYIPSESKIIIYHQRSRRGRSNPLSQTLCHEMTHAIGHLCTRGSAEKRINKTISLYEEKQFGKLLTEISQLLPDSMSAYYSSQIKDSSAKIREKDRKLERKIEEFTYETPAYLFEGIFLDLKRESGSFAERYGEKVRVIKEKRGKKRTRRQEVIDNPKEAALKIAAIATSGICSEMLKYIRENCADEYKDIAETLETVRTTVESYHKPVSEREVETSAATREISAGGGGGGGGGSGGGSSRRNRMVIDDDSSDKEKTSRLVRSASADVIRASLISKKFKTEGIAPPKMRKVRSMGAMR